MNVLKKNDHLFALTCAIEDTERIPDAVVDVMFLNTRVESEEEIVTVCDLLEEHRPAIYDKYTKLVTKLSEKS